MLHWNSELIINIGVQKFYGVVELENKWRFPLRISSHLLKKSLMENYLLWKVLWKVPECLVLLLIFLYILTKSYFIKDKKEDKTFFSSGSGDKLQLQDLLNSVQSNKTIAKVKKKLVCRISAIFWNNVKRLFGKIGLLCVQLVAVWDTSTKMIEYITLATGCDSPTWVLFAKYFCALAVSNNLLKAVALC